MLCSDIFDEPLFWSWLINSTIYFLIIATTFYEIFFYTNRFYFDTQTENEDILFELPKKNEIRWEKRSS